MKSHGLTTIICSTNLVKSYNVCQNIKSTSGLECQFLIHDNIAAGLPIAKVYNKYLKIAAYDYVLFVHQDVKFIGNNWGKLIIEKLNDKKTGCIGYAGSIYRPKDYYAGWPINLELFRGNYIQKSNKKVYNSCNTPFDKVVVIDGMAMFCTKKVAIQHQFDENMLTGFHCYDIDFSLQLFSNGYDNYVFTSKDHTIFHESYGNYTKDWTMQTIDITNKKWNAITPAAVCNIDSLKHKVDIEKNNDKFIHSIRKFFSVNEANALIAKLPYKEKTKVQPKKTFNFYQDNCYRSWN